MCIRDRGSDYQAIARAIRSELNALITDIPQLLDATLMDDTPAANMEKMCIRDRTERFPALGGGVAVGSKEITRFMWREFQTRPSGSLNSDCLMRR